jgi:hypothetical protein
VCAEASKEGNVLADAEEGLRMFLFQLCGQEAQQGTRVLSRRRSRSRMMTACFEMTNFSSFCRVSPYSFDISRPPHLSIIPSS